MKISAQEEYGLRCALQLGRIGANDSLTLTEIAEREGLSTAYVARLLNLLRQADIVQSVRGRSGGYTLSRPVDRISVADVLSALGGQLWEPSGCERFTGSLDVCARSPGCAIRSLWGVLDATVDRVLRNVTLADLLMGSFGGLAELPAPWMETAAVAKGQVRDRATRTPLLAEEPEA